MLSSSSKIFERVVDLKRVICDDIIGSAFDILWPANIDRRSGFNAELGILERGKGDKLSRVVLKVVKTTRRPELCGNVREHVASGATVCTDALMSYDDLEKDYDRQIIDHLECYARGQVHTNGLENFWSLLKRALKGTYVNVEPFHLFRYLDEQAFRFNERKLTDSRAIFSRRSLDSRTALDVSRANRQCGSKLNIASATRQTRRTIMPEPETPDPIKVQVHQRKAALFRVVQADGVWTSVNPWGNLHLTFYSERAPIPTSVYFGPNKDGIWEELVDLREGKKGWFRELEVDVVLTPVAARSVLDTLQRYLEPTQPPSAQTNISTPETK